jgi:hypothetical protein
MRLVAIPAVEILIAPLLSVLKKAESQLWTEKPQSENSL